MNPKLAKPLKIISLVFKILTVVLGLIAALMSIAMPILLEQEAAVNGAFGIKTSEIYEVEGEGARNENYKTEYGSIAELRKKTHEVSRQTQAEGSVLLMNKDNALPLNVNNEKKVSFYSISSIDSVWGGTGSGQAYVTGLNTYESETYPKDTSLPTYKGSFEKLGFQVNEELWDWYETAATATTGSNPTYRRYNSGNIGGQPQLNINGESWSEISVPEKSAEADAAFFVLGRIGGEAGDRRIIDFVDATSAANESKSYLELSTKEKSILTELKSLRQSGTVKKLVLIINASNQPELDWLTQTNEYGFDAALWIGGLGQDGTDAVADLVAGKISPSGKLAVQFWNDHALNPVYANFGAYRFGDGVINNLNLQGSSDHYVAYQEGMYLGYRYAETRYEDFVMGQGNAAVGNFDYGKAVAYPFGYGTSYTNYEYSNFNVTKMATGSSWDLLRPRYKNGKLTELNPNGTDIILDGEGKVAAAGTFVKSSTKTPYQITLKVTNKGNKAGKEAVQVYLQRPYTEYDKQNKIEKPSVELVGFHKTELLQPGASEDVTIFVDEKYFAAYDAYGEGTYVVTPGDYYLTAAANAHEAANNILKLKKANGNSSVDETKIDKLFGQGGDAGLARKFTDPVASSTGKQLNVEKYAYSDVTGMKIKNLFDSVDPNRDPLARGTDNATDNKFIYMTRSDWNTAKFIDTTKVSAEQTSQVVITKSAEWKALMDGRRYNSNNSTMPAKNIATDENPMPTFGAENGLTLSMFSPIPDTDGNLIRPYDYDDPMWDKLLDQLTIDDYALMTRDGYRTTRESASIAKPQTVEHNGPVGFIHKYQTYSGNNGIGGKRAEVVRPFAELGVTKQADGTYLPNRLIPGTDEPMYGVAPVEDKDCDMFPTAFPSNILVASTFNRELVEEVGKMVGEDALWAGYSGIYGTGVNIIRAAHQGRVFEYYSEDGYLSGIIAGRWSRGAQSKGCYVYNKHLALNEQELCREGISTFVNEQAMREIYLRAFELPMTGELITSVKNESGFWRLGTEEYDAKCIMGAFNNIGVEYSITSKALMTDWLRGEAGLSGFTVSDWWHDNKAYMNIGWTLLAGNTLPDGAGSPTNHLSTTRFLPGGAVENVEIVWKMREGLKRVLYTVSDSNAMGGYSQNTRVRKLPVEWPDQYKAGTVTAWVLFSVSLAVFVSANVLLTIYKIKKPANIS